MDSAEGRLLPVGEAAGRLPMRGAARQSDGAGRDLRHRERLLRRRQRPRPCPSVVLMAVAGPDPRGHAAAGGGDGARRYRVGAVMRSRSSLWPGSSSVNGTFVGSGSSIADGFNPIARPSRVITTIAT